jgi:hypothetical protein
MVYHMTIPVPGSHVDVTLLDMTLRFARVGGRWRCDLWVSWDAAFRTTLHRDTMRQIEKARVIPAETTTDSWLEGLDWALTHAEWVEACFISSLLAK